MENQIDPRELAKQIAYAMRYGDAPLSEAQMMLLYFYLEARFGEQDEL